MKTNLDRELTYFILGLPRSGTTIVASLFNSLQDGFCLGEPHWYVETGHSIEDVGPDCCGKVGYLWVRAGVSEMMNIYPCFIRPALVIGGYHLGGYKETWRDDELGWKLLDEHLPRVDFCVLVHRHPAAVHASQMRRNWPDDLWTPERADEGARFLRALGAGKKAANVEFEEFRADPLGCLNKALAGRLQIRGPVSLQPTGWIFGDPEANKSVEVR